MVRNRIARHDFGRIACRLGDVPSRERLVVPKSVGAGTQHGEGVRALRAWRKGRGEAGLPREDGGRGWEGEGGLCRGG